MEQPDTLIIDINNFPVEEGSLIPLLQEAQAEYGYLRYEVVEKIADYLGLTTSQVFGVASFYSQFRFTEPAKHSICVCLGTACHVSGGETLVEAFERTGWAVEVFPPAIGNTCVLKMKPPKKEEE